MKTFKQFVSTKIPKKKNDPVFDLFSKPIEFGTKDGFTTFSGPIVFGQKNMNLKENVLGKSEFDHSGSVAHDKVKLKDQELSKHYDHYSDQQEDHITKYSNGSGKLNDYLHERYRNPEKDHNPRHEKDIKKMDDVVYQHRTPSSMIVHSGVPESPHHIIHGQGGYENKEGGHVVLPAYTSTSLSLKLASNFAKSDKEANEYLAKKHNNPKFLTHKHHDMKDTVGFKHMLKIHVPKGHPGAYVAHKSYYGHEYEHILPRETHIHIHHDPEFDHKNGIVHWHADIVDKHKNRIEDK